MTLNDYQRAAQETALFPTDGLLPILYPVLGLTGEAGEVANKVKKVVRRGGEFTGEVKAEIAKELGDVLWYVATLSSSLGYDLEALAAMNIEKLRSRKERDVLHGEGDNR